MAICDLEGFENGAVSTPGMSGIAATGTGRDGAGVAVLAGMNASIFRYFTPGSDTIYYHMGWYYNTSMNENMYNRYFLTFYSAGGAEMNLTCDGANRFRLNRGDGFGTYLLTSAYMFPTTAAWHSFQGKVRIHDTLGEFILKVDGVEVINYTGDTKNSGGAANARINAVAWGCNQFASTWLDDWMVNDTTGGVNDSWTGEISIQGLRPSGNGAFSELVGSDGNSVDNYQLVDEYPYNTSDYVGSVTSGAKDTYDFTNLIKTGNVLAVNATAYAAKSDAGPKFFRILQRGGSGGLLETADQPLSTTYLPVQSPIWMTDGDGSPWTIARVNASQWGFKVI